MESLLTRISQMTRIENFVQFVSFVKFVLRQTKNLCGKVRQRTGFNAMFLIKLNIMISIQDKFIADTPN